MASKKETRTQYLPLVLLMLASEAIFLLPFVVARVFRPTFLKVFEITNFELGIAFSWYGITAMLSYFFGGALADKFAPRKLMVISLLLTGISGFYMAVIPSVQALQILYGAWGISTILLFWAASLKATRAVGGQEQGLAFGLVDGGRGLLAAILASLSVLLVDWLLPVSANEANTAQWASALSQIIKLFSVFVVALGAVLWFSFPKKPNLKNKVTKIEWRKTLRHKALYYQAFIVLSAYVAYKCTDDFSLYAHDSLGYNGIEAAHVGTISFWMRPIAAVLAGYLGDRFKHSLIIKWLFVVVILGSLALASGWLVKFSFLAVALNVATLSLGIYGLRGLYYALLQEAKIPMSLTGTAVGFISVVGYTPDVFVGPIMGWVLDNNPGELGHQYLFAGLALFALLGLMATFLFTKNAENHSA